MRTLCGWCVELEQIERDLRNFMTWRNDNPHTYHSILIEPWETIHGAVWCIPGRQVCTKKEEGGKDNMKEGGGTESLVRGALRCTS